MVMQTRQAWSRQEIDLLYFAYFVVAVVNRVAFGLSLLCGSRFF
jgi:hypothetical protein